jgi:hypothetical protein
LVARLSHFEDTILSLIPVSRNKNKNTSTDKSIYKICKIGHMPAKPQKNRANGAQWRRPSIGAIASTPTSRPSLDRRMGGVAAGLRRNGQLGRRDAQLGRCCPSDRMQRQKGRQLGDLATANLAVAALCCIGFGHADFYWRPLDEQTGRSRPE